MCIIVGKVLLSGDNRHRVYCTFTGLRTTGKVQMAVPMIFDTKVFFDIVLLCGGIKRRTKLFFDISCGFYICLFAKQVELFINKRLKCILLSFVS